MGCEDRRLVCWLDWMGCPGRDTRQRCCLRVDILRVDIQQDIQQVDILQMDIRFGC